MNIPDEVYRRACDAGEWDGADYKVIAGWARKEALREAVEELHDRTRYTGAFGIHLVRKTIRGLAEGDDA